MSSEGPTSAPRSGLSSVLSGRFLIHPRVIRQTPFILYLVALALWMVASSHSADRKVREINRLAEQRRELHSQFIEMRAALMRESMESKVLARAAALGLKPGEQAPLRVEFSSQNAQP